MLDERISIVARMHMAENKSWDWETKNFRMCFCLFFFYFTTVNRAAHRSLQWTPLSIASFTFYSTRRHYPVVRTSQVSDVRACEQKSVRKSLANCPEFNSPSSTFSLHPYLLSNRIHDRFLCCSWEVSKRKKWKQMTLMKDDGQLAGDKKWWTLFINSCMMRNFHLSYT